MILVTGASGTAGGAVLAALKGRADALAATREEPGPGQRRFDLADPATYAAALDGVRGLFLMLPPGLPKACQRFRALLAQAKTQAVERVAFLSVRNADRLPFLPHRRLEREIEASGLAWTHLRPNDFMQNFATVDLYREGVRAGRLVGPGGKSRTSYIDVRDMGDAAARVLTEPGHENRAYPLTGPEPLTLPEVAQAISAALDRPIRAETPSLPGFYRHARRAGAPRPLALVMTSIGLIARLRLADGVDPPLSERPRTIHDFARDHAEVWR